jgi:hypothetical protein
MKLFVVCSAAAAALVLGIFSAAPAYASHTSAFGSVEFRHKGVEVREYAAQGVCTPTCVVELPALQRRDFRRFVRWAGDNVVAVTVPSGQTGASRDFAGPSTWLLRTSVTLLNSVPAPTTHPSDVVVFVVAPL